MLQLPVEWAEKLGRTAETGMGYQVVSMVLKDGTRFDQVVIIGGLVSEIRGRDDIPFAASDITEIVVTHDKWNFQTGTDF